MRPERPLTFSLEIQPASILKDALELLRDSDYNPHGTGLINVGQDSFAIVAVNNHTKALGCIIISNAATLVVHNPVKHKLINLNYLAMHLHGFKMDYDIVYIHNFDGSNHLFFTPGKHAPWNFGFEFFETMIADFKVPEINMYQAAIASECLRQILEHVEDSPSKIVSFCFANGILTIKGGGHKWEYGTDHDEDVVISGRESWEKQHVEMRMKWPHCNSLKKALNLSEKIYLSPVTDRPDCMMLSLKIGEHENLVYLVGTDLMIPERPPNQASSSKHLLIDHLF